MNVGMLLGILVALLLTPILFRFGWSLSRKLSGIGALFVVLVAVGLAFAIHLLIHLFWR